MSVQVTRLPSGLTVVTDNMPHLQTASLGVWVGSGARDELQNEHGISQDRKSTRLNSSHSQQSRMPSSA